MTAPPPSTSFPYAAASPGWRQVLGIGALSDEGWRRVQETRAEDLARAMPTLSGALALGTLAIGTGVWAEATPLAFGLWSIATAWLLAAIVRGPWPGARLARQHYARLRVRSALLGLAFGAAPILAWPPSAHLPLVPYAAIGAAAVAAVFIPLAPIAMLLLVTATGLGLAIGAVGAGVPAGAAIALSYALCLLFSGLIAARAALRQRWIELALEEKSEVVSLLLREFEDSGADWLWQVDAAKRLDRPSPRLARAAGQDARSLDGVPLLTLLGGDAAPTAEHHRLIDLLNARESFADLDVPVAVGGEPRWWRLSAAPRHDEAGTFLGFRGVGSDVTEERLSAARIARMARFDGLTGLANRLELMDTLRRMLAQAIRERHHCGLLLIDLDKFKPVNDTLGHPVGDQLLKLVAERLRGRLSPEDVAGRLGGDEFAVVMGELRDPARAGQLAHSIITALSQPFEIDGNLIRIGASIGSAIGVRDGRSVEPLVRNADLALYRAKADGRGGHCAYDPSLLAEAERRRALETGLREALDDGCQFHLVYQPVLDIGDARLVRFEALLRWHHPSLGEVPPNEFLPVAEEAQLGARVGEWVLRTACAEAACWPADIGVAVNLSCAQLRDRQLAATVMSALGHAGLAAERLELEVSEAVFLDDAVKPGATIDALRALGVRVALDDFGRGLAKLGYVAAGRFSTIKIDDSFVRGAGEGCAESVAIVRAGIAVAESLGLPAVAEGVETPQDLDRMRLLGCTQVQGHLAGLPLSQAGVRTILGEQIGAMRRYAAAR